MDIMTLPMKDDSPPSSLGGHDRRLSRRASWKFNTDWESAISSFRSGSSSVLSSSFNSWYHVLDIEDDDDVDKQKNASQETSSNERGNLTESTSAREKSFKRSVHTTLLSDDERTSFQSSIASDLFMTDDIDCYPESWDTSDQVMSHEQNQVASTATNSYEQQACAVHTAQPPERISDNTLVALKSRLSELIETNNDFAFQGLTQCIPIEKTDVELLQERVKSLEDLDEELKQDKTKARAA